MRELLKEAKKEIELYINDLKVKAQMILFNPYKVNEFLTSSLRDLISLLLSWQLIFAIYDKDVLHNAAVIAYINILKKHGITLGAGRIMEFFIGHIKQLLILQLVFDSAVIIVMLLLLLRFTLKSRKFFNSLAD